MHILFIEDDRAIREIFTAALLEDGQTVDAACCAEDGLTLFDAHKPDAILLDWFLPPPLSGEGFLRALGPVRANGVRIVVATASTVQIPDVVNGVVIDFILHKPFDIFRIPMALGYAVPKESA